MSDEKHSILIEIFSMDGNIKKSVIKRLQKRSMQFLKQYGFDIHIDNALLILEMILVESETDDIEESISIVSPILKRLRNTEKLDFYDISFLTITIGHAENYNQTLNLLERAFEDLEQYKEDEIYENLKISLYMNACYRLLRFKYKEIDYSDKNAEPKLIDERLLHYINMGLELCEKNENHVHNFTHKNVLLIRKAIFEKDTALIEKCLKVLKKEEKETYRILRREVNEYIENLGTSIGRNQFNIMVGKNIKELRISRRMTHDELAILLGVSNSNVGAYERGEQGLTALAIYRLADIFDISTDEIYFGKKEQPIKTGENFALRNKIFATTASLQKEELEFIDNVAYQLHEIVKKNKRD